MDKLPSLSELTAAASQSAGPGDVMEALRKSNLEREAANADREAKKMAFQAKLRDLGIMKDKTDVARMEAEEKIRAGAASRIPAVNSGVESLLGLGDREVDISALNAQTKANAAANKPGADLTPGQKALDQAFAKENSGLIASGNPESADTLGVLKTNINKLDQVKGSADKFNRASAMLPAMARDFVNPGLSDIEQTSRSAVLAKLRQTLGAQFTEQEGEKIFSQTFNPRLPADVNKRRLERLNAVLDATAKQKQQAVDYFRAKGTLAGYNGPTGQLTMDGLLSQLGDSSQDQRPPLSSFHK